MKPQHGNDLVLGTIAGTNANLGLSAEQRDKHLFCCGGTGTGKSKALEAMIRQDISNWRKSKSGLIVLDAHGQLYDSLIEWLAWNHADSNLPIVPIDLRQDDWIVSYNLLRQRESLDPAVLVDNITEAMAYVWGENGTNRTPLFARWVGNVLRALYENKMTLVEAELLIDRVEKQIRFAMTSDLRDKPLRQDWQFADTLNAKDFESQIGSTVNRLQRFIRNKTMRHIFGQPQASLDFGKALDEGSIILVSLATERAKVSKENAELFGTLMLNDLWVAAQERGKKKGVKPFYAYIDEMQRFVTPTIAENLDEARGFGIHMTMACQFPNQLLDRGEHGRRIYNSIMENASSKVCFRLTHDENLLAMAKWLFMGVMDPDQIKHELYSTKVMAYVEELRKSASRGGGTSSGGGTFTGTTDTGGRAGFCDYDGPSGPVTWNDSSATSGGESRTWTESESWAETVSSVLIPVFGKELSHVQFRSLEEQLFRAMAVLFEQKERHAVARTVGTSAPVSIVIPDVADVPSSPERTKRFLDRCYAKLPFALKSEAAQKQIAHRAANLADGLFQNLQQEPKTNKRRLQ